MQINAAALTICTYVVSSSFSLASAQTQRDLDSHEHGASTVNIVIDNADVFVEFESPWMNLVGFEHEPNTAEQQAQIDQAIAMLEKPETLFIMNEDAACTVSSLQVNNSHDEEHEEEHHDDKEHAEHDEDHDDKEHAEHDEHEHEAGEAHSEVFAEYTLTCDNIDELKTMTVTLSAQWPGIEDIDVQLAGPTGQTVLELNSDEQTIDLSAVK